VGVALVVDRLKAIELSAVDDMDNDLENYLQRMGARTTFDR